MVDVPYSELSPEALRGLIEHFVLREGTDYGQGDYSLAEKVEQVVEQIKRGKAKIVFDEKDNSFDIVLRQL